MKNALREKRVRRRVVYAGKILDLWVDDVRLGSLAAIREVVNHRPAVAVVPILPNGRVVLIQQYRYAIKKLLWEIPAGIRDKGESSRAAAGRELREETGYRAGQLSMLTSVWSSPGFCSERIDLFLARELKLAGKPCPDEDEFIRVKTMSFVQALDWTRRGLIRDAKTVVGLHLAAVKLGKSTE